MIGYDLVVADLGTALYNQSGGVAVGRHLIVGQNAFLGSTNISNGTVQLSGGTLTFSGTSTIGASGNGTFNHTGGTFTTGWLILAANSNGTNATSSGTYNMSNGATLHVAGLESIGDTGMGFFTRWRPRQCHRRLQSFGRHWALHPQRLGRRDRRRRSHRGLGHRRQLQPDGGSHTIGQNLYVGSAIGSTGNYNISGGTIDIGSAA
jgi:hypothetical protein